MSYSNRTRVPRTSLKGLLLIFCFLFILLIWKVVTLESRIYYLETCSGIKDNDYKDIPIEIYRIK